MIKYIVAIMLPICAFAERFEIVTHAEDSYTDYITILDHKTDRRYLYCVPAIDFVNKRCDKLDISDILFHYLPYVSYSEVLEVDYECSP